MLQSGRGAASVEDAQGTPTQSHISPNILYYTKMKLGLGLGHRGWPDFPRAQPAAAGSPIQKLVFSFKTLAKNATQICICK